MSPPRKTVWTALGYAAWVLSFFAYPVLWLLLIFHVRVPADVAWWLAVFPHVVLVVFGVWRFWRLLRARTLKTVLLELSLLLASLLALGWNWLLISGIYMR